MRSKHVIWKKTYMKDMKTKIIVKIQIYFPQIMVHTNFERTTKRIILTEIFYSRSALKSIKPIFQIFWRYLNIYKNDFDLFLNRTNLICNRIIIHMLVIMPFCFKSLTERYIFQPTKCERKGVSRSIDSGDRNFSSVKPQHFFF